LEIALKWSINGFRFGNNSNLMPATVIGNVEMEMGSTLYEQVWECRFRPLPKAVGTLQAQSAEDSAESEDSPQIKFEYHAIFSVR